MRSLHADLTAAQQSASRVPYVTVAISNRVEYVRRHDFAALDSTSNSGAKHDIAVASDGTITRVRNDGAGNIKQQRNNPDISPNWGTWNNLATGIGFQVAAAAYGARVAVIYTNAAHTGIYLRESTDYGATYAAAALITTSAGTVNDLAVAYKNASGDMAIAWADNTTLKIIIRTTGIWGAPAAHAATFASLTGVAMTYGLDWDILLTGTETGTLKATLWSVIRGDGNDVAAATWSTPLIQQQAEATSGTAFYAPTLCYADTYRASYLDTGSYTGGASRVYRTYLHPSLTYAHGAYTWRTPLPTDVTLASGLAHAVDPTGTVTWIYEGAPSLVQRARRALVSVDVSADVLSLDIHETTRSARGLLRLNNDAGQYAGAASPHQVGNAVTVNFGYHTATGPRDTTAPLDLWIAAIRYRRDGGRSTVELTLESGWDHLRRNVQRTSILHTADHHRAILSNIMARAGLAMSTNGASTRAGAIIPATTIDPHQSGYAAALHLLGFLADRLRMLPNGGVRLTEPLTSDASVYTYGAAHGIFAADIITEPVPIDVQHVYGTGAYGTAGDYAAAAVGASPSAILRDQTSTTGAAAAATATAALRQRALDQQHGTITVPANVGQELLDVITINDPYISPSAIVRRVMGIRWRYDRQAAVYRQDLELGPL